MRAVLGIDVEKGQRTWEVYFRRLIEAAEAAGILVMRSGIVGNSTHRHLDVSEFRGFAISHPLAPLVFINTADAPAARLFTLMHELALRFHVSRFVIMRRALDLPLSAG